MAILTSPQIRFTVADYMRMSDAGVFDDRRVELLNGRIYQMRAQGNAHISAVSSGNITFARSFGDTKRFWLAVQSTYIIKPMDAPEPDLCVRACAIGTPDSQLPAPFIVIEVSNKTYKRDSGIKLRRYAAAGVQDYWIVHIPENRIEVYRNPENPTGKNIDWHYASVEHFHPGQSVALLAYPEIQVPVVEMLP